MLGAAEALPAVGAECIGEARDAPALAGQGSMKKKKEEERRGRMVDRKTQVLLKAKPVPPPSVRARLEAAPEDHVADKAEAKRFLRIMGHGDASLALWKACKGANEAMARALIERHGAQVDFANEEYYGYTPLHIASQKGHLGLVRLLLARGAEVNATGTGGETALHEAAHENHQLVALFLVQHGADMSAETSLRKSARDFCVKNGFAGALEHMLWEETQADSERDQVRRALANSIMASTTTHVQLERAAQVAQQRADEVAMEKKASECLAAELQIKEREIEALLVRLHQGEERQRLQRIELEDEIKLVNSLRRKEERELGNAKFVIEGLRAQVEELEKQLRQAHQESAQLDKYIQSSVRAVARKNDKKIVQRRQESPRGIKLQTLEKRVRHAENAAFTAAEQKSAVERTNVEAQRRLARVERELFEIRAQERRRKYAAAKIQLVYRIYRERRARERVALGLQRVWRGIAVRRDPANRVDPARVAARHRRMVLQRLSASTVRAAFRAGIAHVVASRAVRAGRAVTPAR